MPLDIFMNLKIYSKHTRLDTATTFSAWTIGRYINSQDEFEGEKKKAKNTKSEPISNVDVNIHSSFISVYATGVLDSDSK